MYNKTIDKIEIYIYITYTKSYLSGNISSQITYCLTQEDFLEKYYQEAERDKREKDIKYNRKLKYKDANVNKINDQEVN